MIRSTVNCPRSGDSKPYDWFVACAVPVRHASMNKLHRNWNKNTTILIQKRIWKYRLQHDGHFVSASMCWSYIIILYIFRNQGSGYVLSPWETTLQCNIVSHWLSPYPEWSLSISEEDAFRMIIDLFNAGTETTSTTLQWFFIYMMYNQEVQEKCRKEIQEVGNQRDVFM